MKKSKLIIDLVQEEQSLSKILYCLKLILSDFNDEKILSWVNNEINGYSDNIEVPQYRYIRGCVNCEVLHGYQYYQNVNLPINYSDTNIMNVITMYCRDSVSAIETMMKKEDGQFISVIQGAAYPYL